MPERFAIKRFPSSFLFSVIANGRSSTTKRIRSREISGRTCIEMGFTVDNRPRRSTKSIVYLRNGNNISNETDGENEGGTGAPIFSNKKIAAETKRHPRGNGSRMKETWRSRIIIICKVSARDA